MSLKELEVTLPYNFNPRFYQLPVLSALDNGYKRVVSVWHRRSGKDKVFLNKVVKSMYERVGAYYYFFPTYKQGKKVIWNGIDRDGFKFTDHIPKSLRKRTDNTDMLIEMENHSIFQVVGTDNIDAVVGSNPVGCVFSEYSLQNPAAWDYIRPILAENDGWAAFIYTPRGRNHGYSLLQLAKEFPDQWFSQVLPASVTGAIPADVLVRERLEIIKKYGNDSLYLQEYECSFDIPIQGSYYADQLMLADAEGRIRNVPYDHYAPVHTAWDLGFDDSMSIWFFQVIGKEFHFIDYFSTTGQSLRDCIKVLKDKNYVYGNHWAPHDIKVHELTDGKTRWETAKSLGVEFKIAPKLLVQDGIDTVRTILNRCWFDKEKTQRGLDCLRSYHKEWDEENGIYRLRPEHDWASHGADAMRTFATGYYVETQNSGGAIEDKSSFDPYE